MPTIKSENNQLKGGKGAFLILISSLLPQEWADELGEFEPPETPDVKGDAEDTQNSSELYPPQEQPSPTSRPNLSPTRHDLSPILRIPPRLTANPTMTTIPARPAPVPALKTTTATTTNTTTTAPNTMMTSPKRKQITIYDDDDMETERELIREYDLTEEKDDPNDIVISTKPFQAPFKVRLQQNKHS